MFKSQHFQPKSTKGLTLTTNFVLLTEHDKGYGAL